MSFMPNSPQGAVYPSCPACSDNNSELYVADQSFDQQKKQFRKLSKDATLEQCKAAKIPWFICEKCAKAKDIAVLAPLPWPPPSA